MNAELAEAALTETWLDVERMVRKIAAGWTARMGGDFDDCMGVAAIAFMRAYDSWNYQKGAFTTHCHHRVSGAVRNHLRGEILRSKVVQCNTDAVEANAECFPKRSSSIDGLVERLSEDAGLVVRAVLDSPAEIVETFNRNEVNSFLASLRFHFRSLGWTARRVTESFSEIREVMG